MMHDMDYVSDYQNQQIIIEQNKKIIKKNEEILNNMQQRIEPQNHCQSVNYIRAEVKPLMNASFDINNIDCQLQNDIRRK